MFDIKSYTPPSEAEITKSWISTDEVVVSVLCAAFNHENYIEDAIKSFLMQKTSFAFEIVIHDDASSDKTAKLIKSYEEKYPSIIKPIYQSENQYSKGIKPSVTMFKRARGQYIAMCEGDDYWIDKSKLSVQVTAFKNNPNISLCFHPAIRVNQLTNTQALVSEHFTRDCNVSIEDTIMGGGHFMPTASLMFINQQTESLSDALAGAPIGDYFIQMYMSSLKGAFYVSSPMSVYRQNTPLSWSANLHLTNEQKVKHKLDMIKPIDSFKPYLKHVSAKKYLEKVLYNYFYDAMNLDTGRKHAALKYLMFASKLMKAKNLNGFKVIMRVTYQLLLNLTK